MSSDKPILFSGIQPSGILNIGGYLGAIKNWVDLQSDYHCLFSIVDMHAITVRQDPKELRECCFDTLAMYIACGIDPEKSTIFIQSQVPQHAELAWVLNCYTAMGELNRMTQFKDKSKQHEANINVGLYSYPVLQAADILLYQAALVPVGEDQKQHLELTRDVAMRFNNIYGEILTVPEVFIPPVGSRVMSLQDPSKKMSKSDPNAGSYVTLLDPPNLIIKKFKRAVTDSGSEIKAADDKPGMTNLLHLYSALSKRAIKDIEADYVDKGYGDFKKDLAALVVSVLEPIQHRYQDLRADHAYLNELMHRGAEQARTLAQPMLDKVHEAVGFIV